MKKKLLLSITTFMLLFFSSTSFCQTLELGILSSFAGFSGEGGVTNGSGAVWIGDVGSNLGIISGNYNGNIYNANSVTEQARFDLMRMYIHLNDLFVDYPGTHAPAFGGETITPGVYYTGAAGSVGGNLILDGQGDPDAFFVIKFYGAFTVGASAEVTLINGAKSCNVFFIADGAISVAASAKIKGTLFSRVGAVGLGAGAELEGRMLSMSGALTTGVGAIVGPPSCTSTIPVFCESGCTPTSSVDVLGVLSDFALYTSLGAVANTGITGINGKIGTNSGSISGYASGIHIGDEHTADALTAQAKIDLDDAYNKLMLLPVTGVHLAAAFGAGETLTPGVYHIAAAGSLSGTITLDAAGDSDAIFVMRFAGAFTVAAQSKIILTNGAKRCNVFWLGGAGVVTGAVNIGAGSILKGNFISHGGACNSGAGVFLAGRQLSTAGAVNTNTGILYNNPECVTSTPLTPMLNVIISQVYQFGDEKWIEITNIGTTDIATNTIQIQLYQNKTGDLTGETPNAFYTFGAILEAGKSVLFKNSANIITHLEGDATIVENATVDSLTDFDGANDVITLSFASDVNSWINRYDVISNITDKTSYVRTDETTATNKNYTTSEWVAFIDDAILPYQPVGDVVVAGTKRHPQDPLISEIQSSHIGANTMLGVHKIKETTTNLDGSWSNGFPDRSRSVVIDEDFEQTGTRLSARELKVEDTKKLTVTDQLLVVTNNINLIGNIRLAGTSQLIQTHSSTNLITGAGKLSVDQNSITPSLYRYDYMSSPVNSLSATTYNLLTVLKDNTSPNGPITINYTSGYDGSCNATSITLADYWVYTYASGSNGRSNWAHMLKDGVINRGDGYIFKGPGRVQNYTFEGIPNDGEFNTFEDIGAGESYLIGNPFPSAMNAKKFISDNLTSTTGTLYLWEQHKNENGEGTGIDGHTFGGYVGGYATINLTQGVAANAAQNTSNTGNGFYKTPLPYIAIGQAYFMQGDASTGGPIIFNNSQRAYVTEGTESLFFKGSKKISESKTKSNTDLLPIIKLGFGYKNTEEILLHSQIGISFQDTNSFKYDKGYDSEIYETGSTTFYWKFPNDDKKYVIAGVQTITDDLEVPLGVTMGYSGEIDIMVDEIQNVSRNLYIIDKLTGNSYNIKNKKITITLDKGVYIDRFVLAFTENTALSTEDNILTNYTRIYAIHQNNNIVISKSNEVKIYNVTLFDILGKKVDFWNINEQKNTYQLAPKNQIYSGIYILKLNTNKGEINKKLLFE